MPPRQTSPFSRGWPRIWIDVTFQLPTDAPRDPPTQDTGRITSVDVTLYFRPPETHAADQVAAAAIWAMPTDAQRDPPTQDAGRITTAGARHPFRDDDTLATGLVAVVAALDPAKLRAAATIS